MVNAYTINSLRGHNYQMRGTCATVNDIMPTTLRKKEEKIVIYSFCFTELKRKKGTTSHYGTTIEQLRLQTASFYLLITQQAGPSIQNRHFGFSICYLFMRIKHKNNDEPTNFYHVYLPKKKKNFYHVQ